MNFIYVNQLFNTAWYYVSLFINLINLSGTFNKNQREY